MTATHRAATGDSTVTPSVLLRFSVIDERAGEILGVSALSVTDQMLADLFGVDRGTIWRLRAGKYKPGLDTALNMAAVLGIPVEQFAVRVKTGE